MDDTDIISTVKIIEYNAIANKALRNKKEYKTTNPKKEKKDRVITKTKRWNTYLHSENDFEKERQLELLRQLKLDVSKTQQTQFLYSEIRKKMNGYRAQDMNKNKYNMEKFVDLGYTIDALLDSELNCFYCKEQVYVWYIVAREPKQWTLERIHNDIGHNKGNIEIACLNCNIRRQRMYYEKFRFTKQMIIEKTG
jgi:hypothetical protein